MAQSAGAEQQRQLLFGWLIKGTRAI